MKLLLAKLSNHWQLRFLTVSGCVGLAVYAFVMPVHSTESSTPPLNSLSGQPYPAVAAKADASSASSINASRAGDSSAGNTLQIGLRNKSTNPPDSSLWLGENQAAVSRLTLTASFYISADLPRDATDLIRFLSQAADRDDATAEFLMGHAYQTGIGIPRDIVESGRWYARAGRLRGLSSDHGAVAQLIFGKTTAHGEISIEDSRQANPQTFEQAFQAFRRRALEGDKIAQLWMGLAYDQGDNVPENFAQAAYWYREAAAQGSVSAMCNLGELYHDGTGVPKDAVEAVKWLRLAASRGSTNGQYSLGQIYSRGEGVPADSRESALWLRKAANQGSAPAQVLLSLLCATGNGIPGDTAEAYLWINLAAVQDAQARAARDELENVLTALDVAEGQRLTHRWLLHHGSALHPADKAG